MTQNKFQFAIKLNQINPLYPNIGIGILQSILFTLPMVLTRRICLDNQELLNPLTPRSD